MNTYATYCASHGIDLSTLAVMALAGLCMGLAIRGFESLNPLLLLLLSLSNFALFQALVATSESFHTHHRDANTAQVVYVFLFALWSVGGITGMRLRQRWSRRHRHRVCGHPILESVVSAPGEQIDDEI